MHPQGHAPLVRGFAVRKRVTASRTALRFMSSTTDARMGILSYRNSLQWQGIENNGSRTIFENRQAVISRAACRFQKANAQNVITVRAVLPTLSQAAASRTFRPLAMKSRARCNFSALNSSSENDSEEAQPTRQTSSIPSLFPAALTHWQREKPHL
jgi:hypothetical protein